MADENDKVDSGEGKPDKTESVPGTSADVVKDKTRAAELKKAQTRISELENSMSAKDGELAELKKRIEAAARMPSDQKGKTLLDEIEDFIFGQTKG